MKIRFWYILFHFVLWIGLYLILIPSSFDDIHIEYGELGDPEVSLFLFYGFILDAILIYSYAHMALPIYLKESKLPHFLLLNVVYLIFFSFIESSIDQFFFGDIYADSEHPTFFSQFVQFLLDNLAWNGIALIAGNAYGFGFAWYRDQQTKRLLESEKLRAELSALRHQVHPHFLFNILNGLYGLAYKNNDEPTAEGIAKLSNMMRYMIYESNGPKVPLVKEIEYISNYVEIQRIRIDENVNLTYSVEGNPEGKVIVPMILIPFVENAFKYGVSTTRKTKISICLNIFADSLEVKVDNDINIKAFSENQSEYRGVGLKNVKQRLKLVYGDNFDLRIRSNALAYHVSLILPI